MASSVLPILCEDSASRGQQCKYNVGVGGRSVSNATRQSGRRWRRRWTFTVVLAAVDLVVGLVVEGCGLERNHDCGPPSTVSGDRQRHYHLLLDPPLADQLRWQLPEHCWWLSEDGIVSLPWCVDWCYSAKMVVVVATGSPTVLVAKNDLYRTAAHPRRPSMTADSYR